MAIGNRGLIHFFHADANALGATINQHERKPFTEVFMGPPSASLPPVGGHINQPFGRFSFPPPGASTNILSATSTNCEVHGDFAAGYPTTRALAEVTELGVVERVRADKVVAQITTRHPLQEGSDVPDVKFEGTEIRNLTIDQDITVEVRLDLKFLELEEAEKCSPVTHLRDPRLWKKICRQYDDKAGALLCTLVKDVKIRGGDERVVKKVGPNILEVDNLGKIFLAEFLVQYYSYRLTMIRFELGCPTQGDTSVSVAMANGKPTGP